MYICICVYVCVCVIIKSWAARKFEYQIPRRSKIYNSRLHTHLHTYTYICMCIHKRFYVCIYIYTFLFWGEFVNFQSSRMFLCRVTSAALGEGARKTRNFTHGANLLPFHINNFGSIKIWNKLKIPQLAIFAIMGADWLTFHTVNGLLHLHKMCARTYIHLCSYVCVSRRTRIYIYTHVYMNMSSCHLSSSFSFWEHSKGLDLIVGVLIVLVCVCGCVV